MPLPFDELEAQSLVEKLEAYDSKAYLMSYMRLDAAGISASTVRDRFLVNFPYPTWDEEWVGWKEVICKVTGKSWPECAQLIYGEMF